MQGQLDFHDSSRKIAIWLAFMCVLVIVMILVGGATRLTNSGLSITEWKPITGALPPMAHADWVAEFEKYKLIPEFEAEHPAMTLAEFEYIYFWEWGHRQLGRFIGLAYALPFFAFLAFKKLPQGYKFSYWAVLILIGLQGAIGWWMVSSGLVNERTDVHPVRLAVHLGMAFIILGFLIWMCLDAAKGWPIKSKGPLTSLSKWVLCAIYLQIIAGALVAGTHAGDTFKEWPMMDGDFFPRGYSMLDPFLSNMYENVIAIQFNHRILAYLVLALTLKLCHSAFTQSRGALRVISCLLLTLVLWQVGLGVATLLHMDPHGLALAHQGSASLLFIVSVVMLWTARSRAAHYSQIPLIGKSAR